LIIVILVNLGAIMAMYAQTSGTHQTNSGSFVPIPGLSITIPQGVDTMSIVILNVPNPYAAGINFPGGTFGINVNGVTSPVQATFTYNEQAPTHTGRIPTTLVVGVPLSQKGSQTVQAGWFGVRGSTVIIDTPATLTAILG
jgi:mannose-binding lectin